MKKIVNKKLKETANVDVASRFCTLVTKLAERLNLNVFVITDGRSATNSVDNPIISTISEISKDVIDNPDLYGIEDTCMLESRKMHERSGNRLNKVSEKDRWNLKQDIDGLKAQLVKVQNTAEGVDDGFIDELCDSEDMDYPLENVIDKDLDLNSWCTKASALLSGEKAKETDPDYSRYEADFLDAQMGTPYFSNHKDRY